MRLKIELKRVITELDVTDEDTGERYLYKEVKDPSMSPAMYAEVMDTKTRLIKPTVKRFNIFKAIQAAMGRDEKLNESPNDSALKAEEPVSVSP